MAGEPAEEIIVVVNGPQDGSLELVEARARDDGRVTSLYVPIASKTAALQTGIERATSAVVLMLDDDVVPEPGLVEGHARHHAGGGNQLIVGYMPIPPESRRRPGQYPRDLYRRSYERVCSEYERDRSTILHGLWGGNVSMRRADALRVGLDPLDTMPASYWYHEDRDFGLRCAAAGIEAIFDRALLARHEYRATPQTFLRVARDSGHTRWAVHQTHSEAIGELPGDFYERGAPMPGRLLIRLARHRWAHGPVKAFLRVVTTLAGTLRLFRLESHAGYLMGTIEQQRGALDAAASPFSPGRYSG